jgi:hypothetical protein
MSAEGFETRVSAALTERMTSGQRAVLDARMAEAIGRRARQRRHVWRRLTTRTGLLVAALVLVVLPSAFVVSAGMLLSESPFGLSNAAAFQREIDAAEAVTPIPSGATWPASLQAQQGTYYSKGGAYQSVEGAALCLWLDEWTTAVETDGVRASGAAGVVLSYPDWRSYSGEFASQSYRDVIDRVLSAVRRGDRGPVLSYMALNCTVGRP